MPLRGQPILWEVSCWAPCCCASSSSVSIVLRRKSLVIVSQRRHAIGHVIAAFILLAVFLWLGYYVTKHPEPSALASIALALRGHGTAIAWKFTEMGWGYVLAPLYVALIALAIFRPEWRVPALFAVTIGFDSAGERRPTSCVLPPAAPAGLADPPRTRVSYPSSHAAISTGFYFLCGFHHGAATPTGDEAGEPAEAPSSMKLSHTPIPLQPGDGAGQSVSFEHCIEQCGP